MAKRAAKVLSVSALADFKVALIKFTEQAKVALIEAHSDMQRTMNRLQTDVIAHWKHEEKLWSRKLAEAKTALNAAQLQTGDARPSAVIERKAVEAAQHRIDNAQNKIRKVHYWLRIIEKEMMLCRGQLQQLDRILETDVPRIAAMLDRKLQSLDEYLRVKSQSPDGHAAQLDTPSASRAGGASTDDGPAPMQPDASSENDEQVDEGTHDTPTS